VKLIILISTILLNLSTYAEEVSLGSQGIEFLKASHTCHQEITELSGDYEILHINQNKFQVLQSNKYFEIFNIIFGVPKVLFGYKKILKMERKFTLENCLSEDFSRCQEISSNYRCKILDSSDLYPGLHY